MVTASLSFIDRPTWERFASFPTDMQAQFLADEYPQTIVVILAVIEELRGPGSTDDVLSALPEMLQREVVRRRAVLRDVNGWVVLVLEKEIKKLVDQWGQPAVWGEPSKERWRAAVKKLGEDDV